MKTTWKLQPLTSISKISGKTYYEQAVVFSDNYPVSMLHIDNLWQGQGGDNCIYDRLVKGEAVTVEVAFEIAA